MHHRNLFSFCAFKGSMLLLKLFEFQGWKRRLLHLFFCLFFLYCSDSLAWKLFYVAGCFFVAAQNLEQWEVRCWIWEGRLCWLRSSGQVLIPAASCTCSVQTDKLHVWFRGNPRTGIRAIILALHKHENVKLNIRVFFTGRLDPNCFVAFSSSCLKEGERTAASAAATWSCTCCFS